MEQLHVRKEVSQQRIIIMVYWCIALLLPLLVQSHPLVQQILPVDCEDIFKNGSNHNGVYTIYPVGEEAPMEVYCDMGCAENEKHEGGQWTVIQRRMDGSVNFDRPWAHYKQGFGNKDGEYWLGLQNIFLLTWGAKYELRVDMEDYQGGNVYALYSSFSLEPESDGYRLRVNGFKDGGAGDSLSYYYNGQRFSTFDRDHSYYGNCARQRRGGFWFSGSYRYNCGYANPNGQYKWYRNQYGEEGVIWNTHKYYYSLKSFTMKIKKIALTDLDGNVLPSPYY